MTTKIRQLQLIETDILCFIDKFCRENNIKYSLYAGTMLGAVRHHGFIPWDDDIDICMSRKEYDRFIRIWNKKKPVGYTLQNKDNTPEFTQSFTKVRKDGTTFIQEGEENTSYHKGIFIDIFPIDRMPRNAIKKAFFFLQCLFYQICCRGAIPNDITVIEKTFLKLFYKCISFEKREVARKKLLRMITDNNKNAKNPCVGIEILRTAMMPLPSDMMDNYIDLSFENHSFMCIKKWDEYLTAEYHNYMELPPENERVWTHHPICLHFNKAIGY